MPGPAHAQTHETDPARVQLRTTFQPIHGGADDGLPVRAERESPEPQGRPLPGTVHDQAIVSPSEGLPADIEVVLRPGVPALVGDQGGAVSGLPASMSGAGPHASNWMPEASIPRRQPAHRPWRWTTKNVAAVEQDYVPETLRDRILAAALDTIEREGPAEATTRARYAAAEVYVAAINYCFRTKEALLDADFSASWEHAPVHIRDFLSGDPWDARSGLRSLAVSSGRRLCPSRRHPGCLDRSRRQAPGTGRILDFRNRA